MIAAYLTDIITRIRAGEGIAWKEPGAATETDVASKIKWQLRRILNAQGVEVVASGYVLVQDEVLTSDKFRINGRVYGVVACNAEGDFSDSHWKAWLS